MRLTKLSWLGLIAVVVLLATSVGIALADPTPGAVFTTNERLHASST